MRTLAWAAIVAMGSACEPRWSELTVAGFPTCPRSALVAELLAKVEGPRVSSVKRFSGAEAAWTLRLQESKDYTLQVWICRSEPCERAEQLLGAQQLTGMNGSTTLSVRSLPDCVAVGGP